MSTIVTFHVRFLVLSSEDTELPSPPEVIIRQTQERMMRQRGNLKALAGICDFHLSFFPGTSAHFIWLFETPSSQCITTSANNGDTPREHVFPLFLLTSPNKSLRTPLETFFWLISGIKLVWNSLISSCSIILADSYQKKIYWLWCVTLSLSIKSYDDMAGLSYCSLYCRY